MPKIFPPIDIAQMNFYRREIYGCDRVPNCHTRMSVSSSIDHNSLLLISRLMDRIDEHTFMIRLPRLNYCIQSQT